MKPFTVTFPHKDGKKFVDLQGLCLSVERTKLQRGEEKTELFVYNDEKGFFWIDSTLCKNMAIISQAAGVNNTKEVIGLVKDNTKEVIGLVKEVSKIKEALKGHGEIIKKLKK